ncbi:hypothetical protein DL766_002277 [Monosporascus sp. MC13-8B]|uniref:chitinase n=1 Tax=Monosporascus cannonballus TaxID=155416 RepID=A0ABY0HK23_9PEZI|nr:hypothetical protein DL762_000174 [Monosporascus cannonballus]RYP35876.1 hypothetical protein DL766_002277 [Monosporascus sp. MC13-8B]
MWKHTICAFNLALGFPTVSGSAVEETAFPVAHFRGFQNAVYYTNWGAANYTAQQLPVSGLTHILYAFADIGANGTVISSNPKIDVEQRTAWDPPRANHGRNAYGVVKQLFIHKQRHRNLKTLLSIGGWAYSPKFAPVAATETGRQAFARSAVKLVTDWGFDGIDVDWEFPDNDKDKENFVKLLEACRVAFDRYSHLHRLRYRFQITVASPASAHNYRHMDLAEMNRYVDSWHLMAYDYAGNWSVTSSHQANVFANKNITALNTHDAISHYESQGISPHKILMGLPLYGRAFVGTSGLGQKYSSVGKGGPEPGIWYYKDLPKPGAREEYDDVAKAAYSYDNATRELISYDNVRSATFKARYIAGRRLGGAFFWEARGDKTGSQSLLRTMAENLGWLDATPNNLHYPTSQYDNIRYGMP